MPSPSPRASGIVRMKDIAERSNVSLATVSRLLRGKDVDRFPQATRERIFRVAHELGWSPNRLVQGIQTGRTRTIGVVLVPFGDHWQRIMVAIHRELLRVDNLPLALYPDYNILDGHGTGTELDHLQHLMERRVDGLICWPLADQAAIDYLCSVCAQQIPVVTIEFELPEPQRSIVIRTREDAAMQAAIDHLVNLGHTRIGFCGKQDSHIWATDRRKAFIATMHQRGLIPAVVEDVPKDDRSALARLRHDLADVTAVVAGSEQLALSVWHVAREAGRRIPDDLSIVGFGRLRFEFAVWPAFTSIDQCPDEIGRVAAAAVLSPDDHASSHIDIKPDLLVGETTGPVTQPQRRRRLSR